MEHFVGQLLRLVFSTTNGGSLWEALINSPTIFTPAIVRTLLLIEAAIFLFVVHSVIKTLQSIPFNNLNWNEILFLKKLISKF